MDLMISSNEDYIFLKWSLSRWNVHRILSLSFVILISILIIVIYKYDGWSILYDAIVLTVIVIGLKVWRYDDVFKHFLNFSLMIDHQQITYCSPSQKVEISWLDVESAKIELVSDNEEYSDALIIQIKTQEIKIPLPSMTFEQIQTLQNYIRLFT